jgi:FtsP/CotA-like multicopper oxidase with cupredoxin domain
VSADHKSLSVNLTARQVDLAAHPDDASRVTFELPDGVSIPGATARSIVVDGLMLYNDSLAPEVWRLNAGSTLNVRLVNGLGAGELGATNLHTHGLLVSPDLDTRGGKAVEPVGDTVYVCTIPEGTDPASPSGKYCVAHGAYYGTKTSEMNYRLVLPSDHPEGLFWYHPHVHMNARTQVGAGLSGLIFVMAASRDASGGARTKDGQKPTERFLMLKDHQIGSISGADPSMLKASFLPVDQHDAGLCGPHKGEPPYRGVCFNGDKGWLFTVNGQLYPHVTVKSGEQEIWRIANTSADMTYDVALVERDTGRPLRFQLLARDGVSAAQEGTSGPILVERVLLMPSSRIEVGIDRSASEGLFVDSDPLEAVLRTYGYFTGGDAWPAVDLAAVTFDAATGAVAPTSASAAAALRLHVVRGRAGTPALAARFEPLVVKAWKPALVGAKAPAAGPAPGKLVDVRESLVPEMDHAHGSHSASLSSEHPLPLPSPDECKPLKPGEERIIALAIDKGGGDEKFKIGAVRANRASLTPPQWDAATQNAIANSRQFGDNHSPLLCAHAGTTEVWNIVNRPFQDNQETHNFHIHQTKFEVLEVVDPHGRIEVLRGGPAAKRLVDNYPVPIGGSIRIRIRFTENQAGGRFVFHCHILEHEDKGMMAEIEVLSHAAKTVHR